MQQGLTEKQKAHYLNEGFLVAENIFSDAELQPVIDEIDREVNTRAAELVKAGKLSRTYQEYGFERQLALISRETDQVARSIWNGTLNGEAFFNVIRNKKLLDVAESLVGPEIIASSVYRLRPKIPNYNYGAVPWHQDSGYMEPYCDKALVVTVWLPLVDATEENGCLWVIPGKVNQVVKHFRGSSYLVIPDEELPGKPVCVPVKKGSVLFLTNLAPHASFDNKTDVVRWSMDLRYQSAALPTNAPITRLPGEVSPERDRGAPVACYPPEADFLVRSLARPHQIVTDPAEFQRLRTTHLSKPVAHRWQKLPDIAAATT